MHRFITPPTLMCVFRSWRGWSGTTLALWLCATLAATPAARQGTGGAEGAGATRSVWDGVFTDEQARRGGSLYAEHCASCHGATLQGGENRALTGDRFWTSWQDTTVDRLLTHVSVNMPHSEDGALKGTLGARAYADIVAHILRTNGFPPGAHELTAASSDGVQIMRKDGPGELPAGSFVHVVGCLVRGDNRAWRLQRGSSPVRVLSGDPVDTAAPLGEREYALLFVITSLDRFVGHRMSVRGALVGDGGKEGINVTTVTSVNERCE